MSYCIRILSFDMCIRVRIKPHSLPCFFVTKLLKGLSMQIMPGHLPFQRAFHEGCVRHGTLDSPCASSEGESQY